MKLVKNISSIISRVVPDAGSISKRRCYSGSIMKTNHGNIFYRKRNRYEEVIAGVKSYRFGIENQCFRYMEEYDVDLIVIETEYNVWEISVNEFQENSEPHEGINKVTLCKEDFFLRKPKKVESKAKRDLNRGDNDPAVRELKRKKEQNVMESRAKDGTLIENEKKKKEKKKKKKKEKKKVKFGNQTSLF